jgi:hypothetical protein
MKKVIHDAITNETIERDMTAQELAEYNSDIQAIKDQEIADKDLVDTKAAAKSEVIKKLGLTFDEAALLLG